MRGFRERPLRAKLLMIALATSVLPLVLILLALLGYDLVTFRDRIGRELVAVADLAGAAGASALASDDAVSACEILGALSTSEIVHSAALYDQDGRLFASYSRHGDGCAETAAGPDGLRLRGPQPEYVRPVTQQGQRIGTLVVRTRGARAFAWKDRYSVVIPIVAVVLAGAAILLSSLLRRWLTEPIQKLAATAEAMAVGHWEARAASSGDDEISHLGEVLNGMADEIRHSQSVLEERVRERTAELTAANEELDAFAYSVSHDLRSPLRGVDGYSKVLLEDHHEQLPEDARFMLRQVRESAQEMARLIDDLLEFSRLGRREVRTQLVELAAIATAVCDELRQAHPGRDIRFEIGPLPRVPCDEAMLREVFRNLLGNAVKFSRDRTPAVIAVGSRPAAEVMPAEIAESGSVHPERCVACFVRDNGVGFDMQHVDRIFRVFQRLHSAKDFEGTGVGLALVKRIITRHGGCVWAEARVDHGATFWFALPVAAAPSPEMKGAHEP